MRPVTGAPAPRLVLVRRALAPRLALALLAALGATGPGCNDQPLPGTMYGRYKVTGQAKVDSCGAGLGAPDPWVFDAELSREGDIIYWSWMDGSAPLSGPLVSSTRATITTSVAANVDPSEAGLGPCTLARSDDIELTLATGAPPASFTGSISYAFAPQSGATCSDQLTTSGGTYDALPCTVSYTVTAARQ
jgi:hypothetical protein